MAAFADTDILGSTIREEKTDMRKKSIFRQMLIPMIAVIGLLAAIIITIFIAAYEKDIYARNTYLEQIYIQGTDGMQTGRSQGELADRSTRWWFIQMMSEKKPFISQSYYSVATGMPCASVYFPMYREEELVGIYAADMKLDFLQNLIGEYSHEEDGRISFVMDGEGVVVAHPHAIQIEEQYNYRDMTRTVSVKDAEKNKKKDKDGNIITEQIPLEASEEFGQKM